MSSNRRHLYCGLVVALLVWPMQSPWINAQEVLQPDDLLVPVEEDADLFGPDEGRSDLDMELEARGPVRATEAAPGDWFDVTEDGQVSEVLRRHWVRLSPDGRLRGKISTLDEGKLVPSGDLEVSFLQEGEVIEQTTTNSNGRFEVEGLDRGVYCVIAKGDAGFLAYTISVVRSNDRQAKVIRDDGLVQLVQLRGVEGELKIDSVAVPPTFKTVTNLIKQYNFLDDEESRLLPEEAGEVAAGEEALGEAPAPDQQARAGLEEHADLEGDAAASSIKHHVVYLTPDGRLVGKLTSIDFDSGRPKLVEDVTVHIIRNDRKIASTSVKRNGIFEVPALRPGSYSLVATGRSGFGAIGFELRSRDRQVDVNRDQETQFAVYRRGAEVRLAQGLENADFAFPISIALIDDPRNVRAGMRPSGRGPAAAPMGGPAAGAGAFPGAGAAGAGAAGAAGGAAGLAGSSSGFSGGNSGGFSGGGGVGGGLGAVLGAAGLAAGAVAVVEATQDDSVMSPFTVGPPTVVNRTPMIDPPPVNNNPVNVAE